MSRHERDARFHVRLGWLLTLVGFGGFMAWASLAPLDQGVPVQGTVVVSGKRKAVQSMAAGVVSRILVSEGQQVRQGEPLFRLDRTQVQADVDALQAQYRMAAPAWRAGRASATTSASCSFPPSSAPMPTPGWG
jgi:protease secretion system membrane fusion protein